MSSDTTTAYVRSGSLLQSRLAVFFKTSIQRERAQAPTDEWNQQ
jgi:hypothetical protein